MPPTNSPIRLSASAEPPRSSTPAFFRSALRDLASPVPDYASTLALQPEEDVNAANISYLRTPIAPQGDLNAEALGQELREERRRRQQQYLEARQRERDSNHVDTAQERQFQAHRAELIRQRQQSRAVWAETVNAGAQSSTTYGSQIPDQQSLYDWAPASLEADEEELRQMMSHMREEQPDTHPEVVRAIATERQSARRHRQVAPHTSSSNQQEPSLRSAAILQSVSRNWRFSTRSRALMSRYILDREQRALDSERSEQRRIVGSAGASTAGTPSVDATAVQQSETTPMQDSLRRISNHSPWPPSVDSQTLIPEREDEESDPASMEELMKGLLRRHFQKSSSKEVPFFERSIVFIHDLHSFRKFEEAVEGDPGSYSYPPDYHILKVNRDIIEKLQFLRPHRSSWLIPGMTFTGQQQAAPMVPAPAPHASTPRTINRDRQSNVLELPVIQLPAISPTEPWLGRSMTSTPQSLTVSPSTQITTDRWTVKMAIHAVDYSDMTIQGTMEAFNVPSYASSAIPAYGNIKTTFSTYVEGELIDFANHTLLTEPHRAFASKISSDVDADYWRKLEPFAQLSDEEIATNLRDKQWIEEQLTGRYILMRWKERCFVQPTYTSYSNLPASPLQSSSGSPQSECPNATPTSDGPRLRPLATTTTSFMSHAADGNGSGLSISGFYYVSLRRSDGHCEGLYFDPHSSPYQRLELKPVLEGAWGCGAWEMR